MHAYLVFVTRYRQKMLTGSMIEYLSGVFGKVCEDCGADLAECNGEDDHVLLLIEYPPKVPRVGAGELPQRGVVPEAAPAVHGADAP